MVIEKRAKSVLLKWAALAVISGGAMVAGPASGQSTATDRAKQDAARLLIQATYGPTADEIEQAAALGPSAWVTKQLNTPPADTHWAYVVQRKGPVGCNPCDATGINAALESFWWQALRGPDQLRQRTVLALSQLFVVSSVGGSTTSKPEAHAAYLDMLSRNAFGNFRTMLGEVTKHPTMARYLSSLANDKDDAKSGRLPDENYAREVMQLFTIGLWQLNEDGTRKKDSNGNDIPTYDQADVMGLSKVFTGWSWAGPDTTSRRWNGSLGVSWDKPLQLYPQYHSASEKKFLGVTIPPNTDGNTSMKIALDALFNHPNVGPFVGEQLIKRFTTSNPSRAYVARVARAFNNNGRGIRGDMTAVLRAVLLDPEARSLVSNTPGKLREPIVRYAHFLRAFSAKSVSGRYKIWDLEQTGTNIGQNPLRSPSVFNWYRPDYAPSGRIADSGIIAPEFQIAHEATVLGFINTMTRMAYRNTEWYRDNVVAKSSSIADYIAADYRTEMSLAGSPEKLVDRLNLTLMAGCMEKDTRNAILSAINTVPVIHNSGFTRISMAITLSLVAPEYSVQR